MVVKPKRIRIKSPKKTNIFAPKMVIFPGKTLETLVVFSHVTLPKVNHWTKRIDAYLTGISTKLTSVLRFQCPTLPKMGEGEYVSKNKNT